MYSWQGEVPTEEYTIPFGKADLKREGNDVTIITYSKPLKIVMEAVKQLADIDIQADVVDLRSLRPLDEETIISSVQKTNRCVIVDESWPMVSVASHIGWLISNRCFDYLDAPPELVMSEDVPMPYNCNLELSAQPSVEKVIKAVRKVLYLE